MVNFIDLILFATLTNQKQILSLTKRSKVCLDSSV